jgi:hypothetical protein
MQLNLHLQHNHKLKPLKENLQLMLKSPKPMLIQIALKKMTPPTSLLEMPQTDSWLSRIPVIPHLFDTC